MKSTTQKLERVSNGFYSADIDDIAEYIRHASIPCQGLGVLCNWTGNGWIASDATTSNYQDISSNDIDVILEYLTTERDSTVYVDC